MLNSPLHIRDNFGHTYVICRSTQVRHFKNRSPLRRSDTDLLSRLKTPPGFWRHVLKQYGSVSRINTLSEQAVLKSAIGLFDQRTLQIFSVPSQAVNPANVHQRTFTHAKNHQKYQFSLIPLNSHSPLHRSKFFPDNKTAHAFLQELHLFPADINRLCKQFELPLKLPTGTSTAQLHEAASTEALSRALQIGEISVSLQPTPISEQQPEPQPLAEIKEEPKQKSGHVPAEQPSPAPQTTHLCQRNSITVACSHGKTVTLDSSVKHSPTLEIVASSSKGKKPDNITLTSDITDVCDRHKHGHITVSCDKIKAMVIEKGKKTKFDAFGPALNIRLNPVKYAWLPSIKPRQYIIYPGKTCDSSQLENAGKSITLNAYPNISWDWKVNIGYGKNTYTLTEDKSSKGSYKTALQSKRFSITGHVKLTHDNENVELKSEFKQAIDGTIKQIDSVTNFISGIIGNFDQGKKPKVVITWPNLSLNLKTEIAEGADNYRTIAFDFGVSAAPFIGIEASVDILPIIAKPLDGGAISKWLIEEAQGKLKEGIGDKDGLAYLKGEVSIIMKATGSLKFDTHFKGDFSNGNNAIKKVSGKPIEGRIEFSAEGIVEVKGHVLKVKVELVAGVGIKSGITTGIMIDSDDKGYYWKPEMKFDGVKVYITKYVKVESDIEEQDTRSLRNRKTTLNKKTVNEHVWITEKHLETTHHYFIKYSK